jgi:ABC-type Mn2+/Zn2+ transport system ATPase subunit
MEPSFIEFDHASLGYGRKIVVRDISFVIRRGEYFGLVGPNGAGKTTILRAILGSIRPRSGQVRVGPRGGPPVRFGYVPQREILDYVLPYTVQQVVMMGRYRQIGLIRRPGKVDREIVQECLEHVAVQDLGGRPFKDLSGGQKQRVLIARALASRPEALVLDEPTNGMDLPSRLSILELIGSLHAESSMTVIMVTHLLDDVANHVKRLAVVERNFFQVGSPEEVLTGANLSALYQIPVAVERVRGRTVVLPGDSHATH